MSIQHSSRYPDRISAPANPRVWTPDDFADLGPRAAVDQALNRLVVSNDLTDLTS